MFPCRVRQLRKLRIQQQLGARSPRSPSQSSSDGDRCADAEFVAEECDNPSQMDPDPLLDSDQDSKPFPYRDELPSFVLADARSATATDARRGVKRPRSRFIDDSAADHRGKHSDSDDDSADSIHFTKGSASDSKAPRTETKVAVAARSSIEIDSSNAVPFGSEPRTDSITRPLGLVWIATELVRDSMYAFA